MTRFSNLAGRLARVKGLLRAFLRDENGGMAPFMVLGIAGVMFAGAYAFDATRMTTSAAQIKRATDAAAMAVAMAAAENSGLDTAALRQMAETYVQNNLGMDAALDSDNIRNVTVSVAASGMGRTYTVGAQMRSVSALVNAGTTWIDVASVAYAESPKTELAIVVPEQGEVSRAERQLLVDELDTFLDTLFGDAADDTRKNLRVAVVPYGQHGVNVVKINSNLVPLARGERLIRWVQRSSYQADPESIGRVFPWATSTPRITGGHASASVPDARANRLCLHHVDQRDNYFPWRGGALRAFNLDYKMDQTNDGHYRHPWPTGNPLIIRLFTNNDPNQFHRLVKDIHCPDTPLLPLEASKAKIKQQLSNVVSASRVIDRDGGDAGANVSYVPGLVWAGRALSEDMRGQAGWEDSDYPLDFGTGGDSKKYFIMFAKLVPQGFVSGATNEAITDFSTGAELRNLRRGVETLCQEFLEAGITGYFIGLNQAPKGDSIFSQTIKPGVQVCTDGDDRYAFAPGATLAGESARAFLRDKLETIASEILESGSKVRLIR